MIVRTGTYIIAERKYETVDLLECNKTYLKL